MVSVILLIGLLIGGLLIILVGGVGIFFLTKLILGIKGSNRGENTSVKVISFIFPIIGLIIYAVNISKDPSLAKDALKYALLSMVIIPLIITIIGLLILLIIYGVYKINIGVTKYANKTVLEFQAVPIHLYYNEEVYVVSVEPDKVDLNVWVNKADMNLVENPELKLDLSDYKEGTYKITPRYKNDYDLTYKTKPKKVMVKISKKEAEVRDLSYKLINEDKFNNHYQISTIVLSHGQIIIKGAQENLKKVKKARVLIDMSTVKVPSDDNTIYLEAPIKVYDSSNEEVKEIEIVPNIVQVKLELTTSN